MTESMSPDDMFFTVDEDQERIWREALNKSASLPEIRVGNTYHGRQVPGNPYTSFQCKKCNRLVAVLDEKLTCYFCGEVNCPDLSARNCHFCGEDEMYPVYETEGEWSGLYICHNCMRDEWGTFYDEIPGEIYIANNYVSPTLRLRVESITKESYEQAFRDWPGYNLELVTKEMEENERKGWEERDQNYTEFESLRNTIMVFGRYNGKRLSQVPEDYFEWLVESEHNFAPTAKHYLELWKAVDEDTIYDEMMHG
jgi:uncharacterized protein (DUF3820 family)